MCSYDVYAEMNPEDMYIQLCAAIDNVGQRIFKISGRRIKNGRKSGVNKMRKALREMKKEGEGLSNKYKVRVYMIYVRC